MARPPTQPSENGLSLAEDFFGETLSGDLIERVAHSPTQHLDELRQCLCVLRQDHAQDEAPPDSEDAVAEMRVSLQDSVPLAARERLDLLLLLAPSIAVNDPLVAWARALAPGARLFDTWSGTGWQSLEPRAALVATLWGLSPVEQLIRTGDIRLHDPLLFEAIPGHTSDEPGPRIESFTYTRLLLEEFGQSASALDHSGVRAGRNPEWFARLARHIFPGVQEPSAKAWLSEAMLLQEFSWIAGATPARSSDLDPFFERSTGAPQRGPVLEVPHLELSLADAVAMRRNERAFAVLQAGLHETLAAVGESRPGESAGEFAARIATAAREHLEPYEDELRRLKQRGVLSGLVPAAFGATIGLAVGAARAVVPGFHAPGAAVLAKKTSEHLVRDPIAAGVAAGSALRYTANLRLTGRL